MTKNELKKAVASYKDKAAVMNKEEMKEFLLQEEFTDSDADAIVGELYPDDSKRNGFVYPEYDLWQVNVEHQRTDNDGNAKQVKLTAIKILRPKVKIEHNVATEMNLQSHNSRRRYYKAGSVTNGHEETITIK